MKSKAKRKTTKAAKRYRKARAQRQKKIAAPKIKKVVNKIFLKSALKKFKQLLIEQREKIVGEVEHITNDTLKKSQREASGDLSGYTLHMADMAGDHYDREVSLGIASNEQRIIYEIDEALRRIEDGSYGTCFTCDKPITKRRLKVVPYAKYCVNCQQKEELMQDNNNNKGI